MREIKFKIWQKKEKKMYGIIDFTPPTEKNYSSKVWINVDNNTVLLQFTGLKDKNGKDIYEGDIYHQGDKNILYKVIFKDCYFIGNQIGNESLAGLSHFIKDVEVIGNIFENPELLTN